MKENKQQSKNTTYLAMSLIIGALVIVSMLGIFIVTGNEWLSGDQEQPATTEEGYVSNAGLSEQSVSEAVQTINDEVEQIQSEINGQELPDLPTYPVDQTVVDTEAVE